ncbi:GDSL-type esterase/lipase family protein [Rossellomorea arthrocnemi]|jgi:lysophospholipase L1-like esterase|uniref:GDSL-type esterase/lipase family protein n=1 Tax=Rossellomorea arthrocnemi TaxID=2769542 RepID=UPI001919DA57|nr:GDSL-type esterase/lipase family protein [Rossellomorea arthrocnemi]
MKKLKLAAVIVLFALIPIVYFSFIADGTESSSKKRVMALGDSLTYGYGDKKEAGYIGRLEEKVNQEHPKTSYHFQNLGVPGQQSDQLLSQIVKPEVAGDLSEADIYIINIGTNDLIKNNGGDLFPLHHDEIMDAKKDYLDHLDKILNIVGTANKEADIIVLGLYNPYPDKDSDKIEAYVDDWNKSMMKEANKHDNVKYVSINPLFKGKSKENYFHDSLHPNGKGYELIADQIVKNYDF